MGKIILDYEVRLGQLEAQLKKVQGELTATETAGKKSGKGIEEGMGKAGKEVENVEKKINNFANNTLEDLGRKLVAAFAIERIIAFGKASLEEFDKSAKAVKNLEVALGRTSEALLKQAKALETLTLIQDDDIISAQARLAAFGLEEDAIKKLTPLVLDLAKAKGIDLVTAAQAVGQAVKGTSDALKRQLGVSIKDAKTEAERLTAVIDGLNLAAGGQAEASANTGTTALNKLSLGFKNLKESTGEALNSVIEYLSIGIEAGLNPFKAALIKAQRETQKELLADRQKEQGKIKSEIQDFARDIEKGDIKHVRERLEFQKFFSEQSTGIEKDIADQKVIIAQERLDELLKIEKEAADKQGKIDKEKNDKRLEIEKKYHDQAIANQEQHNKLLGELERELEEAELEFESKGITDLGIIRARRLKIIEDYEKKKRELEFKGYEDSLKGATSVEEEITKMTKEEQDQRNKDFADAKKEETEERQKQIELIEEENEKLEDRARSSASSLITISNNRLQSDINDIESREKRELESVENSNATEETKAKRKKAIEEKNGKDIAALRQRQAKNERALAIFNILIDTAQAIQKAIAASPKTFGLPFSAFAALQGGLQIAAVKSAPLPKYKEGVIDFQGQGNETSDSNMVMISKRESILKAAATKKYKTELEAANNLDLERVIMRDWVIPALEKQRQSIQMGSLAQNIANSMKLQNNFDDYELRKAIKKNKTVKVENISDLARAMNEMNYLNKRYS